MKKQYKASKTKNQKIKKIDLFMVFPYTGGNHGVFLYQQLPHLHTGNTQHSRKFQT